MPSGNPALTDLREINRRLDDHEARITATESELTEVNMDIALLADICVRARARAGARVMRRGRRKSSKR